MVRSKRVVGEVVTSGGGCNYKYSLLNKLKTEFVNRRSPIVVIVRRLKIL